jgi:hypothetical protein
VSVPNAETGHSGGTFVWGTGGFSQAAPAGGGRFGKQWQGQGHRQCSPYPCHLLPQYVGYRYGEKEEEKEEDTTTF